MCLAVVYRPTVFFFCVKKPFIFGGSLIIGWVCRSGGCGRGRCHSQCKKEAPEPRLRDQPQHQEEANHQAHQEAEGVLSDILA